MKNNILKLLSIVFLLNTNLVIGEELPFREIPQYPIEYNTGNIVARLIEGLGFRYYWATEGLKQNDLDYRPSKKGRSTFETLEHIYDLTLTIYYTNNKLFIQKKNIKMSFEELRKETLLNLKLARKDILNKSDKEISKLEIIFKKGDTETKYPYWNLINGQITDAIHHTGQVTSFRRTSGNPINQKINVFIGKINKD